MKKRFVACAVVAGLLVTGCSGTTVDSTSAESATETLMEESLEVDSPEPAADTVEELPEAEPEVFIEEDTTFGTVSQQNALESAQSYLDFSAFSRSGLINQLEFEGFSTADAEWALDNMAIDWNEQAAKAAQSYLEYSSFSRSGLIDQLEFEGYTRAQAEYGVDQVGL